MGDQRLVQNRTYLTISIVVIVVMQLLLIALIAQTLRQRRRDKAAR